MTTKRQTHPNFCHPSILLFSLLLLLLSSEHFAGAQTPNGSTDRQGFPNTNFKPSMSITIIVLIAAFVFMAFFSIYIRQCTRESRAGAGNIGPPVGAGRSRRTTRGLDPGEIGAFPTFVYSDVKGLKIGKGALECAVCLNEFEDDETLRLLPKCDHVFHPECIDAWLTSHVTCPVCRANLVQKSDDDTTGAEPTTEVATATENESESENRSSEIQFNDQLQNHVSIPVSDDQNNVEESSRTEVTIPSRPVRSKSTGPRYSARFPAKFPRSHTTGHSLIPPGEDCERFTLRLPDDIRKQILTGKLNRATSCVTFTTRQGSVSGASARRGYRIGGEGSSSSKGRNYLFGMFDRAVRPEGGGGVFSRTRSFFRRTPSVTLGKRVDGGSGSVKSPFDCIGPKADGDGQPPSATRPPV